MASYYVTVTDIGPTRCTVLDCYSRESEAEEALTLEGDEARYMPAEAPLEPGTRAYHDGERCWYR